MTLPAEAQRLLRSATRYETPCGDGSTVWHTWGEGEPLVLLHGGSGSWMHWIRSIEPLVASGRRVVLPDLPGFGDSANAPGGHDADVIVAPLAKGMLQLLGGAPCDLVGFSFGGMVAGFLAAQMPLRVRRLLIVGAPSLGVGAGKRMPLTAWRHLKTQDERNAAHRSNLASLMLLHEESIDELAIGIQAANVVRDRMAGRRLAFTDALARALQTVACPVHAIYGAQDAIYRGYTDELSAALQAVPNMQSVDFIADAGHWVQYERAEPFNHVLTEVLASKGFPVRTG